MPAWIRSLPGGRPRSNDICGVPGTICDVIVCGHGLAGAVFVQRLLDRGLSFHVFDTPAFGNASQAAAGVINPLSLRRDVLTWRAMEMMAIARDTYERMAVRLGTDLWHPIELKKIFPTQNENAQWQRAMEREQDPMLLSMDGSATIAGTDIRTPFGSGTLHSCAWLNIPGMLQNQRTWLKERQLLTDSWIGPADIARNGPHVSIGSITARWIVHCHGAFSGQVGLVPVKGEVLTVRMPTLRLEQIVHRGIFILPIGEDLYRVGSTFEWNDVWSAPSIAAKEHLLHKLSLITDHPVEVIDHMAGVRPASRDRRPILGPMNDNEAIFNGLGSRGGMLAPWCATHLLGHLFDRSPLDPEIAAGRFSSP